MTNLNDLFARDMAFRDIVIETAARAIGSTSKEFAEEWLMAGADEPCTFQGEKVHGCAESVTNLEWMYRNNKSFREYCQWVLKEHPLTFAMTFDTNEDAGEWLMAPHMDAQQDINRTCPNGNETASNGGDSREKLEADAIQLAQNIWHQGQNYANGVREVRHIAWQERDVIELLNRQAEITRKTEQAAWIQQANGLIHEANVERDELRDAINALQEKQPYCHNPDKPLNTIKTIGRYIDELQAKVDELRDELAKRDKGIERLKRQRDTARTKIDELHAECDTCCYKTDYIEMDSCDVDRLEAERDALARDLADCERERERLRQALGCAIDHAHEIMQLVDIEGEVA